MRVIPPHQIGESIISLIDDARQFVVLVSAYNKLSRWQSLTTALADCQKRHLDLHYFVRDESPQIAAVRELGIEPIPIPRLHTKLYLNESRAIFGSMNLHASSDAESMELALVTEGVDEYQEIWRYYARYIEPFRARESPPATLAEAVCVRLEKIFPSKRIQCRQSSDGARIDVGRRNFRFDVERRSGENWVSVHGILPGLVAEFLSKRQSHIQKRSRARVEIVRGNPGCYDLFRHVFRAADGDRDQWSQREIEDAAEFITVSVAAVFSTIADSEDRVIAAEL